LSAWNFALIDGKLMPKSDSSAPKGDACSADVRSTRLGFLLINDFALMSYASVVEPFRAANRLSGESLYTWQHFSVDGSPAQASNDVEINVLGPISTSVDVEVLFVCAGGNPATFADKATFAVLRRLAAKGVVLAGVSGGAFLLARAQTLTGYRCTIHWEHEPAFVETFPGLAFERGLFVIDRGRITCAGGTAGLDLAIEMIAAEHGAELAQLVSDWYIKTQRRSAEGAQRPAISQRYRVSHPGLVSALEAIEANIEEPLTRTSLAQIAGLSVRQLERLFKIQMRTTVHAHYLRIRLDEAMRLLRETDMSRLTVAVACGFANAAHFSRSFRDRFSLTPSAVRRLR
jgi:AraC family carnitine catabolism transcriptional activator